MIKLTAKSLSSLFGISEAQVRNLLLKNNLNMKQESWEGICEIIRERFEMRGTGCHLCDEEERQMRAKRK